MLYNFTCVPFAQDDDSCINLRLVDGTNYDQARAIAALTAWFNQYGNVTDCQVNGDDFNITVDIGGDDYNWDLVDAQFHNTVVTTDYIIMDMVTVDLSYNGDWSLTDDVDISTPLRFDVRFNY